MPSTATLKSKAPPLWKVSIRISLSSEEAVVAELQEIFGQNPAIYLDAETGIAVADTYLPAKPGRSLLIELQQRIEKLRSFGLPVPVGMATVKRLRPQDWSESWKRHFRPLDIQGRMLIRPGWSKRRLGRGQALVVLDPGLSFGTGQHATTRFCLEQLVRFRRPEIEQSFLDIGSGSGILAIAAAKTGYHPVRAFDIDADAVRVALQNARKNRVANKVRIERRDVGKLVAPNNGYDLVCANLIFDLLMENKERILAQLKPGGLLVLAGILESQFDRVAQAYEWAGCKLVCRETEREWKSGAFAKK